MGSSKLIEGQPYRRLTTQAIFDLVGKHVSLLHAQHPADIELERRASGGFPSLRILGADINKLLMALVIEEIGGGALSEAIPDHFPKRVRDAALKFVGQLDVGLDDLGIVLDSYSQ